MRNETAQRYALVGTAGAPTSLDEDRFEDEVEATWFSPVIDRKELRSLMRRTDGRAYAHFAIWLMVLIGAGAGVVLTWRSWWSVPLLLLYGVMYSMSDHHAHELMHGTPFKTRSVNEVLYQINGFMTLHETHYWRWSHTRHHTHTLHVGQDPEIAVKRPPSIIGFVLDALFIPSGFTQLRNIAQHARGHIRGDGEHFIPEPDRKGVIRLARIYVAIFILVIVACFVFKSVLPALLVVTPRFYGGFAAWFFNVTQHAGLREEVYDHRLNTRTFLTNPVFSFMYMNMNYHVEHHMYPLVPFHALPELHRKIKDQCPPAHPSVWSAWSEMLPALKAQRTDRNYAITPPIPSVSEERP